MRRKPAFMHHTEEYLYVAVFNYTDGESSGSIPLSDLDIALGDFDTVKELWSGETVVVDGEETFLQGAGKKMLKVFRFIRNPDPGLRMPCRREVRMPGWTCIFCLEVTVDWK